jgi:hypothetical protein
MVTKRRWIVELVLEENDNGPLSENVIRDGFKTGVHWKPNPTVKVRDVRLDPGNAKPESQ